MDKILSAIKCDICKSILKSPVLLPCSHSVCAEHITGSIQPSICCGECRAEHEITEHHSFPLNQALARIIEAEIEALDFGNVHRDAKNSCDRLADVLKQVEYLLKDPNHFTHQRIGELKNAVQLKGEQLKLKIDDEVSRLLSKLNRYENDCKLLLATSEYSAQAGKLHNKLKGSQSELDLSTSYLNKIKFDEPKWNDIKKQSENAIQNMNDQILEFKNDLLLNKFNVFDDEIKIFNQISIDKTLEYSIIEIDSKILDKNRLKVALSDLLEFSIKSKWSLLYQGSKDGFKADNFHSKCNERNRTLTLIKTTNNYIFGGYTEAKWDSSDLRTDKNTFLFSLVNKDKSPIKMNINKNDDRAIYCMASFGPIFGSGHDICISDGCNLNSDSYSKLGGSFVHPGYLNDAEQAKCFLAGESNFKVAEIEVFQKIS